MNTPPHEPASAGPTQATVARTASPAQIAANRANALRATGPRTEEGKAKSSANAVKHGLYVKNMGLMADALAEDSAELEALSVDLHERYRPQGAEEEWIVDRLAATWWELARVHRQTHAYLGKRLDQAEDDLDDYRAVADLERTGVAQARLERSLTRLRRDLVYLQRHRARDSGGASPAAD